MHKKSRVNDANDHQRLNSYGRNFARGATALAVLTVEINLLNCTKTLQS